MKEIVLIPLLEEPKVLEDVVDTWTVENWRSLNKKEHGPVFQAGGFPWSVKSTSYRLSQTADCPQSGESCSFLSVTTSINAAFT